MADVQNIRIKYVVDTTDLDKADKSLNNLNAEEKALIDNFRKVDSEAKKTNSTIQSESKKSEDAINKTSKSSDAFGKGIQKVGGAIVAAFAVSQVISFTKEIIAVTGQFQRLEAVLTNTLGSKSAAQASLSLIKDFASTTPFGVAELTESFVKLANQGFIPTRAELTKLGDLASSTGKSFDQLTEGIIDAQTGEFERLKEFGIRAKKEGDNVTFTFKGVETQTKFTSQAIRDYVLSLGEAEGVTGAMAAISETLEGKVSNLGDSYDSLLNTIGSGNSGVLSKAISLLNDLVGGLETALLTEDQLYEKQVNAQAKATSELVQGYIDQDLAAAQAAGKRLNLIKIYENEIIALQASKKANEELAEEYIFGTKEFIQYQGVARGQQMVIDNLTLAIKKETEAEKARGIEAAKAAEEAAKNAEKEFKRRLSSLSLEEQIAIRRAKLADQTEGEINMISQYYNDRRIGLYQRYGKAVGLEFESVKLKGQELESEYTDILEKELHQRLADQTKFNADYEKGQQANFDKTVEDNDFRLKNTILRIRDAGLAEEAGQRAEIEATIGSLEEKKLLAQNAGKETIDLELEIQAQKKALLDLDVKNTKEAEDRKKAIRQEQFNLGVSFINGLSQIYQNSLQGDLTQLQINQKKELAAVGDNKQAQAVINSRYAKQEADIKTRQAKADKAAALFNIAINTAQAVAKAISISPQTFGLPFSAFALAQGAIQAGVVASKPIPKYKKGTKSVPGHQTGEDTILALLQPEEAVIPVAQNKKYAPLVAGIIDGTLDPNIFKQMNYSGIKQEAENNHGQDIVGELKAIKNMLQNKPMAHVTVDKRGIRTMMVSGNSENEFVNNYFRN